MDTTTMRYVVTGSAGFIGFHVARKLLEKGAEVVGIDNFNDYYDPSLKEDRNKILETYPHFTLMRGDIADIDFVRSVFSKERVDIVCHLAAQAGVRYSIKEPYKYVEANLIGFINILNEAKNVGVKNFVFASSSSVYGETDTMPFKEDFNTDKPLSLYAATKKSNEVIAHAYHHLFGMHCTGLRFFTVYGPWGRPDMAMFSFTKAIIEGTSIQVFNDGNMRRDFTYIDDIANGVIAACERAHPYEIINLGNHEPVKLSYMIEVLEKKIGKSAAKEMLPMQPGDVPETYASIQNAKEKLDWVPQTDIEDGVQEFVDWYQEYYSKK